MTLFDVMYLIGGLVGIICLAVWFDPLMSVKNRLIFIVCLLAAFGAVSYLVLGDSPIPENHVFPIQL